MASASGPPTAANSSWPATVPTTTPPSSDEPAASRAGTARDAELLKGSARERGSALRVPGDANDDRVGKSSRPLRGSLPPRSGRNGRGVAGAGLPAFARGGDQGSAGVVLQRSRPAAAVRAGGQGRRALESSQHHRGL